MEPEIPEVRQCTNPESHLFGAVAVKQSDNRWAYAHNELGGGWATLIDVQGWTVMALVVED